MLVKGIKEHESTLKKLNTLMNDPQKKVQGVFYTNSFFSQRYLCRSHALVDNINIEDNQLKLTVVTRLEQMGLLEIENTLDMLVRYGAGDIPGFTPEGILENEAENMDQPHIVEAVSVGQFLYSLDLLLIMKDPKVTYQEFTIAGTKFTLVNIYHRLSEDEEFGFDQTVTLLFGEVDKLYFFSHFFDKKLTLRDLKILLNLIVDENITGKAITAIRTESEGAASGLFPVESLISSYYTTSGDIVFNTNTGYIRLDVDKLQNYKAELTPNPNGSYLLDLVSKQDTMRIYFE